MIVKISVFLGNSFKTFVTTKSKRRFIVSKEDKFFKIVTGIF